MSRTRGVRLQLVLARYLAAWWPQAESAGSGRAGVDVLGTPGVAWECKTAAQFEIHEFVRQAVRQCGRDDLPLVAYFPPGAGEHSVSNIPVIVPMCYMIRLLIEAGYAPEGNSDGPE